VVPSLSDAAVVWAGGRGDSIARLAPRLDAVTAGSSITACDVRHPRFATTDLTGQRIVGWVPRGKHLLMRTDAAITVHSHLRMSGRWTVLGAGKRLPRAVAARLRIALRLDDGRTDAARTPHGRETWWCPGCQR
jgi:endonuclease-8